MIKTLSSEGVTMASHHRHNLRHRHRHGKANAGRVILITVLIVALLALGLLVGAYFYINSKLNKIEKVNKAEEIMLPREEETFIADELPIDYAGYDTVDPEDVEWSLEDMVVLNDPDIHNILLIGQDRRPNEKAERSRSDSMILVSINSRTNKITLISIMRDLYVPIPGYSDNKINEAYKLGGMTLLDQTIEQDLGVHIDGNVEVDFERFIEVMTLVGDIEVEITQEEADYLNEMYHTSFEAGNVVLDPEMTLAYCRIRKVYHADFGRTARQRKVIRKIFAKFMKLSPTDMLALVDQVLPYVMTDLSNTEIMNYMRMVVGNRMSLVDQSYRIPQEGAFYDAVIRDMAVLVPDLKQCSDYLKQTIYGITQ